MPQLAQLVAVTPTFCSLRALETEFLRDRGDPISADWGRNPGEGVIDMPPGRLDEEDVQPSMLVDSEGEEGDASRFLAWVALGVPEEDGFVRGAELVVVVPAVPAVVAVVVVTAAVAEVGSAEPSFISASSYPLWTSDDKLSCFRWGNDACECAYVW